MTKLDKTWSRLAPSADVAPGSVAAFTVGNKDIAVYNVDGEFFATSNVCSHAYALLSDGFLEGHEIECPLHSGRFDVRSGKGLCSPITEDIKTYSIRVADGNIEVLLDDA